MEKKPKIKQEKQEDTVSTKMNKEGNEKFIIDCDADPFVPEGWRVKEHQKGGQFEWNPKNVELWVAEGQKNGEYMQGSELYEETKTKSVLNANVLDYLLAHKELIPDDWKDKDIFFWGTVYQLENGGFVIRCLGNGTEKGWTSHSFGQGWDDGYIAALRKS
jgi:hypothetical protein